MNLTHLTDLALDESLITHGKKFKTLQSIVLFHLVEVEKRKLHLSLGYSSLQNYIQEKLEIDGGSAQRLIDATRLHLAVPTVIESLHKKELTQAQVSFLQKSFRQMKTKVTRETKKKLIEEIKNKSVSETQVIVSKTLDLQILENPKITFQQNNTVNFNCPIDKETWEKMEKMRELLSTAVPSGNWQEILKYLADKVIASKTPKAAKKIETSKKSSFIKTEFTENVFTPSFDLARDEETKVIQLNPKSNSKPAKNHHAKTQDSFKSNDQPVPLAITKQVLYRDKCCQFVSKTSGKKCNSLWNLQVDHIKPRWAGGDNSLENLRVLCANHNRLLYREQAGIRRV